MQIKALISDGKAQIEAAGYSSVDAEILEFKKAPKILVVKHHPKKRYRRVKGHRQDQTTILIKKINEKE